MLELHHVPLSSPAPVLPYQGRQRSSLRSLPGTPGAHTQQLGWPAQMPHLLLSPDIAMEAGRIPEHRAWQPLPHSPKAGWWVGSRRDEKPHQWCAVAVPCLEHNGSENWTLQPCSSISPTSPPAMRHVSQMTKIGMCVFPITTNTLMRHKDQGTSGLLSPYLLKPLLYHYLPTEHIY